MNHRVSASYALIWRLKGFNQYKFDAKGNCINTNTGRLIKHTINGGCKGYCINGKFMSENKLRSQLEKIKDVYCPF